MRNEGLVRPIVQTIILYYNFKFLIAVKKIIIIVHRKQIYHDYFFFLSRIITLNSLRRNDKKTTIIMLPAHAVQCSNIQKPTAPLVSKSTTRNGPLLRIMYYIHREK